MLEINLQGKALIWQAMAGLSAFHCGWYWPSKYYVGTNKCIAFARVTYHMFGFFCPLPVLLYSMSSGLQLAASICYCQEAFSDGYRAEVTSRHF